MQLAKSQLGFIDLFAEPLWRVGAEIFFPGMLPGLSQIRSNRAIWVSKLSPPTATTDISDVTKDIPIERSRTPPRETLRVAHCGSLSTSTTASGGKSDTTPTSPPRSLVTSAPKSPTKSEGRMSPVKSAVKSAFGPRRFLSNASLNERRGKVSGMRKERSFSSLIFWRKRDKKTE
jgi:hypothetical protein